MRHLKLLCLLCLCQVTFGQIVKIDSSYVSFRRTYTTPQGYKIGTDSIQQKRVRVIVDGGDTTTIPTETLVSRDIYKFITIDSLGAYLPTADFDEKAEDKIGDKFVVSGYLEKSYNDGTGVTTVNPDTTGTVGLATKKDVADITAGSGLTAEQVLDTTAFTIKLGEGLQKTKDDTGDSVLIELKLKDALERIVWSTGCHKAVFMATNTTGGTAHWGFQISGTGTVTQPTKSTTNRFQFANRWETLVAAASTTAVAGYRTSNGISGFGNASGMGGFYYNGVSGAATGLSNTNARFFNGYSSSTSAPTDVNPSTLTNMFGIGYDASDSNLQFMHNNATGTATKVDLGSSFAVTTTDRTNFYRVIMYAESNGSTVYYKVIDMVDGDIATGSVSTDLPSNTTMFGPYGYTSVGGSSAVTGFSLMSLEIFSDF